jgi:DNA-binding NarL/FixJ family response regulator
LRSSRLELWGAQYVVLSYPAQRKALPADSTAAEREVALLIGRGFFSAEIAAARGVALRTVANQVAALFRKLGASSRVDVARKIAG